MRDDEYEFCVKLSLIARSPGRKAEAAGAEEMLS